MLASHDLFTYSPITGPDFTWRRYGNRVGVWRLIEMCNSLLRSQKGSRWFVASRSMHS